MKNFKLKTAAMFLFLIFLITGCQKETLVPNDSNLSAPLFAPKTENSCQLVMADNSDPSYNQRFKFYYNADGFADKWDISDYGLFTQKYNSAGKILQSRYSVDNTLVFTVDFIYNKNGRLVKNIYYDGNSRNITDEVFYSYNTDGKLIEAQSFMNDYIAVTKYTPEGNVLSNELLFGGSPVYTALYSYRKEYKNPYKTVSGIELAFPYYTPASYFGSKSLFAGERQIMYDVSGNSYLVFDDDADKTVWQKNKQFYPVFVNYYDIISTATYINRFSYMNCTGGIEISSSLDNPATASTHKFTSGNNILNVLKRDPSKSLKQQVDEARALLKYYPKL